VYKRQIYQIVESNLIEKIDSIARIESKLFSPELECSTQYSIKFDVSFDFRVLESQNTMETCRCRCTGAPAASYWLRHELLEDGGTEIKQIIFALSGALGA